MGSRWRSLIGVILLLAVFGGMPALAPPAAAEPRTVTVVTHDLDPFVMRHGDTLTGFTIDLWDEISKRRGWNTVYTSVPDVAGQLRAVADGHADVGAGAISITSQREKAEHIRRIVAIAKRGFRRIEKLWDETEVADSKAESLAAATLDKHDSIIRCNLGMNETPAGSCSLNLHVLTGGRAIISPQQSIDQSGGVAPEKIISQDPAH